jgi:hypothetical protein
MGYIIKLKQKFQFIIPDISEIKYNIFRRNFVILNKFFILGLNIAYFCYFPYYIKINRNKIINLQFK